jgi:hypothetical protein
MATIELQDSIFAHLLAEAERRGVSLETYLGQLAGLQASGKSNPSRLSGAELERLLDAEASSDSAYQGTYSRADIYRDHD